MTEKAGFLGLGTAGGMAAGAAAVAAVVGVLYATGTLSPDTPPEPEPVAALPASEVTPATEPAPSSSPDPAPVAEAPTEPQAPAASETPAEAPDPVEQETASLPTADPVEDVVAATPDPEAPVAETSDAEETPAQPEATPLTAPSFDVVRAAPDGTTLVAGKGAPGSAITVLVDGRETDSQTVDQGGDFVSFLSLGPSAVPRVLSLIARLDGQEALSAEEIILAPTPAPQVVEVAPEPDVQTGTQQDTTAPATVAEAADPTPAQPVETAEAPVEAAPATEDPVAAVSETADEATSTRQPDPAREAEASTEVAAADPDVSETAEPGTQSQQAPAAVAVLRADDQGVELLQPATPSPAEDAAQPLALDTIGYSPDGDVLLSGRAGAATPIRIYLDNAAVSDVSADTDGRWRVRLTGIEPGVYTLRLDALDADGAVISRLETPFKRESPEALAAAQAPSEPANAEVPAPAEPAPVPPIRQVTVQAGDTLWAISRARYGDGLLYVRVFEANRSAIRDPDLIYPGQVFTIPE